MKILKMLKEKNDLIDNIGSSFIRYALAIVLIWIGCMKFTAYEAGAIEGLIASSPFIGWLYSILSLQGAANLIGTIEITTGILLILGSYKPVLGVLGSLLAIATFAMTSTFLFSAPGWEASLGGFPALSVVPGQFLLKDIALLGSSIWLLGASLKSMK